MSPSTRHRGWWSRPPNALFLAPFLILLILLGVMGGKGMLEFFHHGEERYAIDALQAIRTAQGELYASQGHFGDLQELSDHKLIDPPLARGRYEGYRIECGVSAQDPSRWLAVATPLPESIPGKRTLAMDESGVLYSRDAPFDLGPDCRVPPDALPVH